MKNFKLKRLLSLAFIWCLSTLSASTVYAAANDTISNTATLTFDVGGAPTILESSEAGNTTTGVGNGTSTDFVEDRLINFTVAEVGAATSTVTASATAQVQTFTVTNNGNAPQDFLLAALQRANGTADPFGGVVDDFAPTSVSVFVETATAGYAALDDTNIFIDELAAGANVTVYIVADIPAVADGSLAVMTLVAQVAEGGAASGDDSVAANAGAAITNDDNGNTSPAGNYSNGAAAGIIAAGGAATNADVATTMETVFNDPAGDLDSAAGAGATQNGQHADSDSYTVQAAALTVSKNAVILWDPVNGSTSPKAIPGAYMTYTLVVTNNGAASGDLTTLTDTLPASLALDSDFVTNAGPGNPTNNAGESFTIAHAGGSTRTATSPAVCTGVLAGADGCDITGQLITLDFATIMPIDAGGGSPYVAGELKAGETVTIVFNAIVQ